MKTMKNAIRSFVLAVVALTVIPAASAQVVEYIHTDALGSPVAITNESKQVIERTDYEPYGSMIGKANNDRPGYAGHVMDSLTGLTYMQQRYYDPTIGRFLSTDPVQANASTGVSFNRYDYANNNPYKFTDPDGRKITFAPGYSKEFYMNAAAAIRYLIKHDAASPISKVWNSDQEVVVRPTADRADGRQTVFVGDTAKGNVLYWADQGGLKMTDSGTGKVGVRSPALALGHEFDHAANFLADPSGASENSKTFVPKFDNLEEMNVIKGYENPAARGMGEPVRDNHHDGTPVKTENPCNKDKCP